MTRNQFQNLALGQKVTRRNSTIEGKVWSLPGDDKVRVQWLQGLRAGTRTTLHFSGLVLVKTWITESA